MSDDALDPSTLADPENPKTAQDYVLVIYQSHLRAISELQTSQEAFIKLLRIMREGGKI